MIEDNKESQPETYVDVGRKMYFLICRNVCHCGSSLYYGMQTTENPYPVLKTGYNLNGLNLPSVCKRHLKRAGETSSWLPGHEPFCLLPCAVICRSIVGQSMYLSRYRLCIYKRLMLLLFFFWTWLIFSPMRIHACAVEINLALGTVVCKPNLWTKIHNLAPVYVWSSWKVGLNEFWNYIRKMDEQICTQHDQKSTQTWEAFSAHRASNSNSNFK